MGGGRGRGSRQPESAWVAEQIGAPVFKVFNGIWRKRLLNDGKPAGAQGRIALPIADVDGAGKKIVFDLIEELGFDAVDAGTIEESWRQQPGTPVYGKDYGPEDTRRALAEPTPERGEDFRAQR